MVDSKGKYSRFSTDKCGSMWFQRFASGCQSRMGVVWKPNLGMSTPLLLRVFREVDRHIEESETVESFNLWTAFKVYAVVSYTLSLRGNEGLLIDLDGTNRHWKRNDGSYLVIALKGKIKGETIDREHLIPCTNKT